MSPRRNKPDFHDYGIYQGIAGGDFRAALRLIGHARSDIAPPYVRGGEVYGEGGRPRRDFARLCSFNIEDGVGRIGAR